MWGEYDNTYVGYLVVGIILLKQIYKQDVGYNASTLYTCSVCHDCAPCVRAFFLNPTIFGIFRYFLKHQDVGFSLCLLKILWRLFISLRCDIFKERLYLVQEYFWAGSYTFFQMCLKSDLLRKPMLTHGYIRKTQDLILFTEAKISKM